MKHYRLFALGSLLLAALLALPSAAVFAQDGDTPVTGDANAASLAVVRQFLENFDLSVLADDVVVEDPMFSEPLQGEEELAASPGLFFSPAFENQRVDPLHYFVVDDSVIAEFIFIADNTGEFFGTPATGQEMALQMAGIFQTEGDEITHVRLYYDQAQMGAYYGYGWGFGIGAPPVAPAAGIDSVDVDDVAENEDEYVNQIVTVNGEVDRVINDRAFTLQDQDIIDLGDQEFILVIAGSSGDFGFSVDEHEDLSVTGVVREFNLDSLEQEVGYALDRNTLAEYQDLQVLVADVNFGADDQIGD